MQVVLTPAEPDGPAALLLVGADGETVMASVLPDEEMMELELGLGAKVAVTV